MKAKYWTEIEILSWKKKLNDQRGEKLYYTYLKQIALDKHGSESYKNNKPH